MSLKDKRILLPVVLAAVILVGMVLAFTPGLYSYDVRFSYSDGTLHYQYESDVEVDTTTVMLSNTGDYAITHVVAYLDEGYASVNDHGTVAEMLDDLSVQLGVRGVDMEVADAEGILEAMRSCDPSETALLFASGSLPDVVFDGTRDSPLVGWLERGGAVVNAYGCLGKYVSTGPDAEDIVEVAGYGWVLAGVPDEAFNDAPYSMYAGSGCNEAVRDALHFYMTEYTYGIDITGMANALNLGYVSASGYSAAAVLKSYDGMIMNFGVTLDQHEHSDGYIAQIVASGVDYSSEILEVETGDTRDNSSGSMDLYTTCSVYAFVGSTGTVYAERFDFVLRARHR